MALYKQAGSRYWWISVCRPGQVKRIRASTGTESREEAALVERTLRLAQGGKTPRKRLYALIDASLGTSEQTTGIPLTGLWEAYEQAAQGSGRRPTAEVTARIRRATCRRLAAWAAKNWPNARTMQDVDQPCAFAFGDWLRAEGTATKTRVNILGDLGTVWRTLMPRVGLLENVWTMTRPTTTDGQHGRAFTPDEEKDVFKAAKKVGRDWHPVSLMARYTGLRYGDIAKLRWEAVDLGTGRLILKPSKTARHGIELGLPLHPMLATMLTDRPHDPGGYVFPEHATCYGRAYRKFPFSDVLTEAGITKGSSVLTFHCWRHTFRTRLSEVGVSQEIAMALGGWTRPETAGLYSHDWQALNKAVQALK